MGGKLSKKKKGKIKTTSEPHDSQEPRCEESLEESDSWISDEEKSYNPGDSTLQFVDGEDEMDCEWKNLPGSTN